MAGKNMQRDKSSPFLLGYNFSPERAREARDKGKLLTMRTETSLMCNLACRYCNGTSGTPPPGEISFETIKDVITQARDLGAESVRHTYCAFFEMDAPVYQEDWALLHGIKT